MKKRRIPIKVPSGCILAVDGVEFVAESDFVARVEQAKLWKPSYMTKWYYGYLR